MAQVTTIDVTGMSGAGTFPLNANDVYGLVETLAVQNIKSVKSQNQLKDACYEYDVENGAVIEEAVLEMAQAQAFDKSVDLTAEDPTLHVKYFNNWEAKQFKTTIRRDDIRKVIANKGVGVEDVVSEILDTLTQGESDYDYKKTREAIFGAMSSSANYDEIRNDSLPLNAKGVIYAIRDAFNMLTHNNKIGTTFTSATPAKDVRVAINSQVLNLIDVVELANVFNLSKEELMGKLVIFDTDDMVPSDQYYNFKYYVFVYDVKAMGRATRVFDYTQDVLGGARYTNHYLTTERAYFYNNLFKSLVIDCTQAYETAIATILG